jgi:type II secretory pathway pseudopilin PulG
MVVRRVRESAIVGRTHDNPNLRIIKAHGTTSGYTLIEIVVVFAILGGLLLLVGRASGSFQFWRDEAFLRTLRERLEFLHYRAVSDQLSYQMEISLQSQSYRIGVLRDDQTVNTNVQVNSNQSLGELSLELADFLNPATGSGATMIPPPSFPSLYEWVALGGGSRFDEVRTRSEQITASTKESVYLVFHPEGFSEFAVIHLTLASGGPMTIVVNPFTGLTESYRGHKDFRWTYGNR